MFLAGLFSGFVILGLFLTYVFPRLMFTVSESKYDFSRTVEELTDISAMMPCRVAVYEKADGKTYISRINPGLFA